MVYRRTLKRAVSCSGIGLHTGKPVSLTLRPAEPGSGIVFRRTDLGVDIPATVAHLARLEHATTLAHGGASVNTVEHLLSALYALGVDDVRIDLEGPEVPILDGSAAPFVLLIHEAGLRALPQRRLHLRLLGEVEVRRGAKWARLSPANALRISYVIGFDHPALRHQAISMRVAPDTFVERIAPARTFGFMREVETLRENGLAQGGSLENAIVIGEEGVLNAGLRFEDEFVRHKVLDAIGDLALCGYPVLGHLEVSRGGHALHAAMVLELMAHPEAWELDEADPRPRVVVPALPPLAAPAPA
jgi:UDP-3-O-[3-hydroxymyristoyl] N-acetylglucosamine deacetylase